MNLGFIFREAWQGLGRNFSMVISIVLVTFVSLTFVGTAILLQFQINQMKGYWYDRAQVSILFCTESSGGANCVEGEASEAQIAAVTQQLQSAPIADYVEEFVFEDHQTVYDRFLEQFGDSTASEWVTPEMLNQTIWINMKDPSQAEIITETFTSHVGVWRVSDQRSYLEQIFTLLNIASYTAIGIAGLMLVAAALLISTTIRLSAFSRRRELSIMRLVGASNGFIQTPFIIEGVIAAVLGALLAGGAIFTIVAVFVQGYLAPTLPATSFIGTGDALIVLPILVGLGVILAAFSSSFAINRYLKV